MSVPPERAWVAAADDPEPSFRTLLRRWPRRADIAGDLGLSVNTVSAWWRRDTVVEPHWEKLAHAALQRGLSDVTYDAFRAIAAARRAMRDADDRNPQSAATRTTPNAPVPLHAATSITATATVAQYARRLALEFTRNPSGTTPKGKRP